MLENNTPIPASVLIVDDNPAKLAALAAALDGMDIEIVTATSGTEALRKLLAQEFAAVLLDVNMPIMDGFEPAPRTRSRPRSEHLPIIFVTAERLSEDARMQGYGLGAVDYLLSPVLPYILRAKVAVFAELHRLHIMLREQSIRDDLTGLYNRRYLNETLVREIERARRKQGKLAAIMLDVNFFKSFNDTYGHEAGDMVLAAIGRLLMEHVRASDVPCRYGGDEFTVLLPDGDAALAAERVETICRAAHGLRLEYEGKALPGVTLSFGVAEYPLTGETGAALLAAADAALYRAKQGDRDRVEIAAGSGMRNESIADCGLRNAECGMWNAE